MWKIFTYLTKWFIIIFLVLTFVFIYLSIFDKHVILDLLNLIRVWIEKLWYFNYIIILFLGFVESFPLVGVSVPGQTVLLMVAGVLWYKNIYFAITCATIGALLWNYFGYLLGVKYWNNFFEKYWKWVGVTPVDVKYIKKWIKKYWWLLVIFWKFHNLFRAFVPFIAGSSKMNNRMFTIFNIIWSLLRAIVIVSLWVFFVENAEKILNNIWKILLCLLLWLIFYVYFFQKEKFMKYLNEKQKELD